MRPARPDIIRKRVQHYAEQPPALGLTRGIHGVMIGMLNEYCGGDENRRNLIWWMFRYKWELPYQASTKDLTPSEWEGLYHWIAPAKPEDGTKWVHHEAVPQEVANTMLIANSIVAKVKEHLDGMEGLDEPPPHHNMPDDALDNIDRGIMMSCGHHATHTDMFGCPICSLCDNSVTLEQHQANQVGYD